MSKIKAETQFSSPLLDWYDQHGRKDLPWQTPREAYRVWVSEIMLQQTQVQTVIPYFNRFIHSFPTIVDLAQAPEDLVLALWSGLGYYSRARNLHATAQRICQDYRGIFPSDLETLLAMPGIGPSTAAAILSQAFNQATAILDGNVKRVLTRFFRITGWPEQAQVKKTLWAQANLCMPEERCADYTQAIMDLGALCCTTKNPKCIDCPVQADCQAYKHQEQSLYPTKKIKKPVPLHQQQFLVLCHGPGIIYLEKKPPVGLWAGLWCLPSIAIDDCPLNHIKERYNLIGDSAHPVIEFTHRFSHFHLHIKAVQINVKPGGQSVAETTGQWVTKDQLSTLGLAKPTSHILALIR